MQLGGKNAGNVCKPGRTRHQGIVNAMDVGVGNGLSGMHQGVPFLRDPPLRVEPHESDLHDPAAAPRACGLQVEHGESPGARGQQLWQRRYPRGLWLRGDGRRRRWRLERFDLGCSRHLLGFGDGCEGLAHRGGLPGRWLRRGAFWNVPLQPRADLLRRAQHQRRHQPRQLKPGDSAKQKLLGDPFTVLTAVQGIGLAVLEVSAVEGQVADAGRSVGLAVRHQSGSRPWRGCRQSWRRDRIPWGFWNRRFQSAG